MKYKLLMVVVFLLFLQDCKTRTSILEAEGSNALVLYTRGSQEGVENLSDNDNMFRLIEALGIRAEFIPNISGQGLSKDQTKEEMFENISKAINYLGTEDTLWWYMFGHGTYEKFSSAGREAFPYTELFDHMLNAVKKNNKIIRRLNLFVLSCHSGSLIPIITDEKYKNNLYKELIVFTPVEASRSEEVIQVSPELIASASFLKMVRSGSIEKASVAFKNMEYGSASLGNDLKKALKKNNNCLARIKFINSMESSEIQDSIAPCDIKGLDIIKLSSQENPTWNDLIKLTIWLFDGENRSVFLQHIQFTTYPESLKDEPIFK